MQHSRLEQAVGLKFDVSLGLAKVCFAATVTKNAVGHEMQQVCGNIIIVRLDGLIVTLATAGSGPGWQIYLVSERYVKMSASDII